MIWKSGFDMYSGSDFEIKIFLALNYYYVAKYIRKSFKFVNK